MVLFYSNPPKDKSQMNQKNLDQLLAIERLVHQSASSLLAGPRSRASCIAAVAASVVSLMVLIVAWRLGLTLSGPIWLQIVIIPSLIGWLAHALVHRFSRTERSWASAVNSALLAYEPADKTGQDAYQKLQKSALRHGQMFLHSEDLKVWMIMEQARSSDDPTTVFSFAFKQLAGANPGPADA